jgi:hypothetical protein
MLLTRNNLDLRSVVEEDCLAFYVQSMKPLTIRFSIVLCQDQSGLVKPQDGFI